MGELGGSNTSTFNHSIYSLTTDASGNVYAAGMFSNSSDPIMGKKYVAKWNGSVWSELGGNYSSTFNRIFIFSLTTDASGNVYAGGDFENSNGKKYVAKWNGSIWSELGGTNSSTLVEPIRILTTDAFGNVYAAGSFTNSNGNNYVAKWNGSSWGELGGTNSSIFGGNVYSLTTDTKGNVYAAGGYSFPNVSYFTSYVSKYTNALQLPSLTSFTPTTATTGTTVTITGTNFTGATAVSFGGTAATSFTVVNATTITAVVGGGTSGSVSVTTSGGTVTKTGLTYCTAITPSVNVTSSRTTITPGTFVTFTATATNAGITPKYTWLLNNGVVQTGTTANYTTTTLNTDDVITVTISNAIGCINTVTSSPVSVYVSRAIITTVAGNGTAALSGDGGSATNASIYVGEGQSYSGAVSMDKQGNMYIASHGNLRVRKVNRSGIISTFAGTNLQTYNGDGITAITANLCAPINSVVDQSGNVYVADICSHRIRKISTTGIITTIAGTGIQGYSGDGAAATVARLNSPSGITIDDAGNLFITDAGNQRIRKISNGVITTIAGNGINTYSGDGGLATNGSMSLSYLNVYSSNVAIDKKGNIYIPDLGNNRIRKVDATGYISTYAGTGNDIYALDGVKATLANISGPISVAVDDLGNLFIADIGDHRIFRVNTAWYY